VSRVAPAWVLSFLLASGAAAGELNTLTPEEERDGFVLLFNGRNLDGWSGNPNLWSVQNGAIMGSNENHKIEQNTFLIYNEPVANFILRAQVRLHNGNSGIPVPKPSTPGAGWIVSGYQADFSDAGTRSAWVIFYEERGRSRR